MMKNRLSFLTSKNLYMSEVLGLKHYLCPESVFALRSLKGGMTCSVLNVVFKPLSEGQNRLLKKIMSSVDIVDFSCLEVKNPALLEQIFCFEEGGKPADLVCFFGGEVEGQKEWIKEKGGRELIQVQGQTLKALAGGGRETQQIASGQEIAREQTEVRTKNQTKNQIGRQTGDQTKARRTEDRPWFFIQTVGLEGLDGSSPQIRENKIALWAKLKKWKNFNSP